MSKSGKELYVGSLSYDVTEYDIEKLFSVSGRVTSIHLITDLKTGEFKGCGYVRMSTEAEARDAVNSLDGAMLIDRQITVSIANAQKMRPSGGGAPFRGKPKGGGSDNNPNEAKPAAPKTAAARPAAPARPSSARPATGKPAFPRSEAPKAGFSRSEGPKTGFSRSDAPKSGFSRSEAPDSGFSRSEGPKTRFSKPGGAKTGFSKPGGARPGSSRPSSSKPTSSKSGTTRTKR